MLNCIGVSALAGEGGVLLADLFLRIVGENVIVQAFVGGLFIAAMNMFGALSLLILRNPTEVFLKTALGFAAGVMLSASFTSLIIPGVEIGGLTPVVVGMVIGVVFIDRAEAWMRYVMWAIVGRGKSKDGRSAATHPAVPGLLLFIVAITIHNMPEGLAVGVGFGAGDIGAALSLMLAIGLQNIPEGLAVSIAARNAKLGGGFYAVLVGIRSGLVEIPLTVLGATAVTVMTSLLPYAMGFAAGAMLYVVIHEIIPETHTKGAERIATFGTMAGLIVMMVLDIATG